MVVDLRLYALIDGGEQVDDPQPVSLSVRCARYKLAALELSVLMSMRLSRPPTGVRLEAWERIGRAHRARDRYDPATLHALKFSLTPTPNCAPRSRRSGPASANRRAAGSRRWRRRGRRARRRGPAAGGR